MMLHWTQYKRIREFIAKAYPLLRLKDERFFREGDYYQVHLECRVCGPVTARYYWGIDSVKEMLEIIRPTLLDHVRCGHSVPATGGIRKITLE